MKNIGLIFLILVFSTTLIGSCSNKDNELTVSSMNSENLETLENHLKNKQISLVLYEKLKHYLEAGGELDTEDWLFYLQYKFENEEDLNIPKLQQERHSEIEINPIEVFKILKRAGFFLDDNKIAFVDKTDKIKKRELVEYTGIMAIKDPSKAIWFDGEGDVCKENNSYTVFLNEMKSFTKNNFYPTSIHEKWETEEGPITVNYNCDNQGFIYKPEYWNDWYDIRVLEQINKVLDKKELGIYTLSSGFTGGQEILLIFLHKSEKAILEKEFNWQLVKL